MNRISRTFTQYRSLITLHLTVFIWGFTGILGALITIPATQLVWYRVLIAAISLLIWLGVSKTEFKVSTKSLVRLFATGAILALHWILFFHSIKISTVSVTLVSLSSITLFTSILEPIINRKSISKLEVIIGLFIITGIYMIFEFERNYTLGIITGLVSAICASMFSIINAKLVKQIKSSVISFYELLAAWIWITIYFLATNSIAKINIPNQNDLIFLLILGVICTAIAYVAGVSVMKELSAFRVALITNLEPIYGIIMAYIFFGEKEEMSIGFYLGSLLILGSIVSFPYLLKRKNRNKNPE